MAKNRKIPERKNLIMKLLLCFLPAVLFATLSFSSEKVQKIYTIQIGSFVKADLNKAIETAKSLENKEYLENVRVESISNLFTVRAGNYGSIEEAKKIHEELKKLFPKSFVRDAYYIKQRIVYPVEKEIIPVKKEVVVEKEVIVEETVKKPIPPPQKMKAFPEKKHKVLSYFARFIFILFFILLILPFLPGIKELIKPKDNKPLPINQDYIKDPRYFDKSFKDILMKEIGSNELTPGKIIKLSKKEIIEITNSKIIMSGQTVEKILYVQGDLTSQKKVKFEKEIYVTGKTVIGEENTLRAILCENDILFSQRSRIIRWVGAEGNVTASEKCNLGVRTSCEGKLEINKECTFKSLFGKPVVT